MNRIENFKGRSKNDQKVQERCSASLAIMEMPIEATLRYHLITI
jgi:hypothetical protein